VREDLRAVVSGKSRDEKTVLEVLDRLKQSKALADVKLLHLREAGGSSREVSFAIRFTFVASPAPAAGASAAPVGEEGASR